MWNALLVPETQLVGSAFCRNPIFNSLLSLSAASAIVNKRKKNCISLNGLDFISPRRRRNLYISIRRTLCFFCTWIQQIACVIVAHRFDFERSPWANRDLDRLLVCQRHGRTSRVGDWSYLSVFHLLKFRFYANKTRPDPLNINVLEGGGGDEAEAGATIHVIIM